MKLTIEVSDELISNLLVSGRGGIAYWARSFDHDTITEHADHPLLPTRYKLDIRRGIELMINKYPRFLDPKLLDAEAGDVFIQLAAFGEIKYG